MQTDKTAPYSAEEGRYEMTRRDRLSYRDRQTEKQRNRKTERQRDGKAEIERRECRDRETGRQR